MAKTFSIDRILHGEGRTPDAESSESSSPGVNKLTAVDYRHPDVELVNQMAAAAYYPAASLLNWHPAQASALWYQQTKQLAPQPFDLSSLAAAHHQQQVAAAIAPSQAFPFGWIPAVNPSDLAFFQGGGMPYFPGMVSQNVQSVDSVEQLMDPWHHHRLQQSLLATGAAVTNHVRAGLTPVTSRKGGQIRFDVRQSHQLEETFSRTKYLTPGQRRALAVRLALSERQVKTWFQNRRAKWRRTKKEEKQHQDGKKTDENDQKYGSEEVVYEENLSDDSEDDSSVCHGDETDPNRKP